MRLQELEAQVRAVEGRAATLATRRSIQTGWPEVDRAFPGGRGVPTGVVHEWFTPAEPPLGLLSHLAGQACQVAPAHALAVWIGRRCWPYPRRLGPIDPMRCLFIDPRRDADRLWAIELCARSPAVAAVVADGRQFDMSATRRLQLAAQSARALVLLTRPDDEAPVLSAAAVRWRARPVPSPDHHPRWSVELLRCKGLRPASIEGPPRWTLEGRPDAPRIVPLPADLAHRPPAPTPPPRRHKIA